ncbi:MAG: 3'-5' exoribonuclease [Microgenomates group bacterium GW2011_GWA2_46_7]|nr:MAG: 3'-5' exoribonuclease [Microgenomates group bacterium GW2011_GWA2_46_7]
MYKNLHNHIVKLLKAGTRLDGRRLEEYRKPITVEYDIIKTAEGSARVKIGETDVMVGVKMEVGTPYPDVPDEGTIIVGAELLPLSNPEFELGPPGIQAIELARVVDRGIRESKAIDFKKLCIEKGKKVWLLLIDICPINDAGNLIEASSLAALAALKSARFPKYDEKAEKIDYKEKTSKKIELTKEPIAVNVIKIDNYLFVDPITEEEKVIDARLSVSSERDGTLCALQKGGDAPLTIDEISKMIDIAVEKGKELRGVL